MSIKYESVSSSSQGGTSGFKVFPEATWSTCFSDVFAEEKSMVPLLLSKFSAFQFRSSTIPSRNDDSVNEEVEELEDNSRVRAQVYILLAEF